MRKIYEEGDKVEVTAISSYGICYRNKHGGTEAFRPTTTLTCTITKAWHDYETGQRYIGKTDDGQEIYFGQFGVEVKLAA
jgi:hypothetical protein